MFENRLQLPGRVGAPRVAIKHRSPYLTGLTMHPSLTLIRSSTYNHVEPDLLLAQMIGVDVARLLKMTSSRNFDQAFHQYKLCLTLKSFSDHP